MNKLVVFHHFRSFPAISGCKQSVFRDLSRKPDHSSYRTLETFQEFSLYQLPKLKHFQSIYRKKFQKKSILKNPHHLPCFWLKMTEKDDFGEFSPLKDMDLKTNFDQLDELYNPSKAVF